MAVAVQGACQRGGIAPKIGGARDFAARLSDGFAGLQRFDQGHAVDVRLDQVSDLQ